MRHSISADRVGFHIGSLVRARRAELGLSEDVVARAISKTVVELREAEAGRANFSANEIFELCETLRVAPSWFFEGLL